ncbi:MAG: 3-deoxy-manno-octulosonate cytidylyltransferase [Deltaproteobacteria bacterium]|jgi:3-deoxy-manno-octulosonate cytidylyltransferase (CMP-KDO synthetase)|nr:3-deoxy-manno-octulosonate cytidylyltransferase [Deltaproteobacteria bacterium]
MSSSESTKNAKETKLVGVIPARWASSRFPGKPLALIAGQTMIERVYARAKKAPLTEVYVATDDQRIFKAVTAAGGQALMTAQSHASGTDRLAEAASLLNLADDDVVVNVQGDLPLLDPDYVGQIANSLLTSKHSVTTIAVPFDDLKDVLNPNHVKVVFDSQGRALYFSRAPIPFTRDGEGTLYYKHVGLYAYRVKFLRQFLSWPRGLLEAAENLEQLRILEKGFSILVKVGQGPSPEIDVPEDVATVEAILKNQ